MVKNSWNTELYENKHSYVFKFGQDVLNLLNAKPGEEILDLGCGTGQLTNLIAESGAHVHGIDSSIEMIKQAKLNYSVLNFEVMDATKFTFEKKFDAVFSNAVLHWIPEKEKVVDCVYNSLKHSGRFVAEFGGKNNVEFIVAAIRKILTANGYSKNMDYIDWYFPSVGEYSTVLEKFGFRVTYAIHFNRDTFLDEGIDVISWLNMFANRIFEGIDRNKIDELIFQIKEELISTNIKDGKWFIDYKRLRISAVKE